MALWRERIPSLSSINDGIVPDLHRYRKTPPARVLTGKGRVSGRSHGAWRGVAGEREWRQERFYATCKTGLEEILAAELSSSLVGASQVEAGSGGVSFAGTVCAGYNANLWVRSGDRVLCELARGVVPTSRAPLDRVCEFVREAVNWPLLLFAERDTFRKFSVHTRVSNCEALKDESAVSNAIWDALRDAVGGRWPGSPERKGEVSVPLFLFVDGDEAVLYRDMSGVSLEERGYGDSVDKAKSREAVAAAVLTIAGWNHMVPGFGDANKNTQAQERVILDPFCGTGTILIEAALMACSVAPGLMRRQWPFQTWHDYDERAWTECRGSAISVQISSLSDVRLIGNDMSDGAIAKCKRAASAAGVLHLLDLSSAPSRHYRPPATPSLVITRPPCSAPLSYSSLRGEDERLLTLWQGFGGFLRSQCRGADVYVLAENDWLARAMRLVPDRKWDLQPDKRWRGRATGRKADVIFGSQERKLLHYHLPLPRRPQGDPISALPFSPLSPKSSRS